MHPVLLPSESFIYYCPQTLTTLNLGDNGIGPQEAQHLANALQQNEVIRPILLFFLF